MGFIVQTCSAAVSTGQLTTTEVTFAVVRLLQLFDHVEYRGTEVISGQRFSPHMVFPAGYTRAVRYMVCIIVYIRSKLDN